MYCIAPPFKLHAERVSGSCVNYVLLGRKTFARTRVYVTHTLACGNYLLLLLQYVCGSSALVQDRLKMAHGTGHIVSFVTELRVFDLRDTIIQYYCINVQEFPKKQDILLLFKFTSGLVLR